MDGEAAVSKIEKISIKDMQLLNTTTNVVKYLRLIYKHRW